jgi:hypothetical protein
VDLRGVAGGVYAPSHRHDRTDAAGGGAGRDPDGVDEVARAVGVPIRRVALGAGENHRFLSGVEQVHQVGALLHCVGPVRDDEAAQAFFVECSDLACYGQHVLRCHQAAVDPEQLYDVYPGDPLRLRHGGQKLLAGRRDDHLARERRPGDYRTAGRDDRYL